MPGTLSSRILHLLTAFGHYGLQLTGSRFLDHAIISLKPQQLAGDLFQSVMAFIGDNLLTTSSEIIYHGEIPDTDEELPPSLKNFVVLTWLRLLHLSLPQLAKQRYGTELRSRTLASVKLSLRSLKLSSRYLTSSTQVKSQRSYALVPRLVIASFPFDADHYPSRVLSSSVLSASRLAAETFGHISSAIASFCQSITVSSRQRFARWLALN